MKKIKIKSKTRIATVIVIAVLLIMYCILILSIKALRQVKYEEVKHTVVAGDTLWNLAKQNITNDVNIQEYIYNIEALNNCTANLQIGQEITLLRVVE